MSQPKLKQVLLVGGKFNGKKATVALKATTVAIEPRLDDSGVPQGVREQYFSTGEIFRGLEIFQHG